MAKTETERHVLYGGAIEIDYYPNSHRYKLVKEDGQERKDWLKSPSGIVKYLDKSAPLMHWATRCFYEAMVESMRDGKNFSADDLLSMLEVAKKAYSERREEAANVGTTVHSYAQNHLTLKSVEETEGFAELNEADQQRVRAGAAAFDSWYAQLKGESVASEFLVYSRKEGFTGRADDLVRKHDGLFLLDYKTSKGIYTDQIYQVTSYMKAREEEYPEERIDGAILLHLCKEDVTDKEGNVIKKAGEFGELVLSRADLVQGYVVFKALKVIADKDPIMSKLIEK